MSEPARRGQFWAEASSSRSEDPRCLGQVPPRRKQPLRCAKGAVVPGLRSEERATGEGAALKHPAASGEAERPGGERDKQSDEAGRQPLPRAGSPPRRRRRGLQAATPARGRRRAPRAAAAPVTRTGAGRPASRRSQPASSRQCPSRPYIRFRGRPRSGLPGAGGSWSRRPSCSRSARCPWPCREPPRRRATPAAQANPGSGLSKVAIRAGQSLWSVAESATLTRTRAWSSRRSCR